MMTLALKGVGDVDVVPCAQADKPAWLLEQHGGSLPCLVADPASGEGAVTDSGTIAQFIDATYGEPHSLFGEGAQVSDGAFQTKQAFKATSSLFGAIAKYIKNADEARDEGLTSALEEQLGLLEKFLAMRQCPVDFLSGSSTPGLADASLAPKLFVLKIAGGHYKGYALDASKFPCVAEYQARVFALPAFESTKPRESEILHGWGQARGGGH